MSEDRDDAPEGAGEPLIVLPVEADEPMLTPPVEPRAEPPVEAPPAAEGRTTYLTADWSDRFGPAGHFHDLTADEAAEAEEGVLVLPTAEQLALRRR